MFYQWQLQLTVILVAIRRQLWYPTSCSVQTRAQLVWPRLTRSNRSASRSTFATCLIDSPVRRPSCSRQSATMIARFRWIHQRLAHNKTVTLSSLLSHRSHRFLPNSPQPPPRKECLSPGPTSIRSSQCLARGRVLNNNRQSQAITSNHLCMWLRRLWLAAIFSPTQTQIKNCLNQTLPLTICSCSSRKRIFLAARAILSQCSHLTIRVVRRKTRRCQASCTVVSHQTLFSQPTTLRIT